MNADRIIGQLITFVCIILALCLGVWIGAARSETVQQWIHRVYPSCCDHRDCFPVHAWPSNGGWIVHWHGVEVPYLGEVRPSPGETYACGTRGWVRCLFISGGVS